jgi:hypothetical protein
MILNSGNIRGKISEIRLLDMLEVFNFEHNMINNIDSHSEEDLICSTCLKAKVTTLISHPEHTIVYSAISAYSKGTTTAHGS